MLGALQQTEICFSRGYIWAVVFYQCSDHIAYLPLIRYTRTQFRIESLSIEEAYNANTKSPRLPWGAALRPPLKANGLRVELAQNCCIVMTVQFPTVVA